VSKSRLEAAVAALFDPVAQDRPGLVGVELEQFPLRVHNGEWQVVDAQELRALLAADAGLEHEANVSFEPGGQLEISPRPASPRDLAFSLSALLRRINHCTVRGAVRLEATGVNRWLSSSEIGQRSHKERYEKMQAHFDAIGPCGREMMRRTAALQVCLDLLPGEAGLEEWHVLNLAGPALAAAFSIADDHSVSRSRIWAGVDRSRTALDGRHLTPDAVTGYLEFARRAEAIPLDFGRKRAGPFRTPFAEWVESGDGRPDDEDVRHHLSTLFPPVRPRGHYLEVRYLDSMPWPRLLTPVCVLAALAYEPHARRAALNALHHETLSLGARWSRNAALGSKDACLVGSAADLFEIALDGMRRLPVGYLPPDAIDLTLGELQRMPRPVPRQGVLACA
jgi:glutamate--cysteine ligase